MPPLHPQWSGDQISEDVPSRSPLSRPSARLVMTNGPTADRLSGVDYRRWRLLRDRAAVAASARTNAQAGSRSPSKRHRLRRQRPGNVRDQRLAALSRRSRASSAGSYKVRLLDVVGQRFCAAIRVGRCWDDWEGSVFSALHEAGADHRDRRTSWIRAVNVLGRSIPGEVQVVEARPADRCRGVDQLVTS